MDEYTRARDRRDLEVLKVAEERLIPAEDCTWSEDDVPLGSRGVSMRWLYEYIGAIDRAAGNRWQKHRDEQKWAMRIDGANMPEPPNWPEANFTTRQFVESIVVPLTAPSQSPLFARVPLAERGKPSIFLSHTWDSRIVSGAHGSLDMVIAQPHLRDAYVWIDLACYNQHLVSDESIASDMNTIIGGMEQVAFLLSTAPFFTRSWCLWELVCAHQSSIPIEVYDQVNRVRTKYASELSALPPDFTSITELTADHRADQDRIFDLMIETFGTVEAADTFIRQTIAAHHIN